LDVNKKFVLLSAAGQLSIVVLATSFLLSFFFFVLPGTGREEQGWFIISWNLPGPLMFISVFRIHSLRIIHEKTLGKKNVLGMTRWVRFWFLVSIMFGLLSVAFLLISNLGSILPLHLLLGAAMIVTLWTVLVSSTIVLFKTGGNRRMLNQIERARERERILLALTSIVFLIFTGFSSAMISLPGFKRA
jgi:hypothetical protein